MRYDQYTGGLPSGVSAVIVEVSVKTKAPDHVPEIIKGKTPEITTRKVSIRYQSVRGCSHEVLMESIVRQMDIWYDRAEPMSTNGKKYVIERIVDVHPFIFGGNIIICG